MADAALTILLALVSFGTGAALAALVTAARKRREIRRLQDIIMALDDSDDTPAWLKTFGRKR